MTEDYAEIMSEPPGGDVARDEDEFLAGGFDLIDPSRRTTDGGMTAHRGDLDVDAYIDPAEIQAAVEESLGFTYAEVTAAYKQGPKSPTQLQHRDKIDSRLLELSRAKANMTVLAETVGLSGSVVDRALARAKMVEIRPIVKNPAVKGRCVSFMTGLPGAKPRRRRHVGCPSHMLPAEPYRYSTINLTGAEYAGGGAR